MKQPIFLLFLLGQTCFSSIAQELRVEYREVVQKFVKEIKSRDKRRIASQVFYPLRRQYPIPEVANEKELLKRFSEVFDDSLMDMISHSDIIKDWDDVGWRGIMLFNGDVWLDYDGKLIAINYQSKAEKNELERLIKIEKENLHPSIRNFDRPVLIMETAKFRIRIDELRAWNFRYVSWSKEKSMEDKPDLIIENGRLIPEGSGGNHRYEFKNNGYVYACEVVVIGADESPPAILIISKGEKEILVQDALYLKGN